MKAKEAAPAIGATPNAATQKAMMEARAMPTTGAERRASSEARRIAAGWSKLPVTMLTPEETSALDHIKSCGDTTRDIIGSLILAKARRLGWSRTPRPSEADQ